jgi:hypothetical protein
MNPTTFVVDKELGIGESFTLPVAEDVRSHPLYLPPADRLGDHRVL